MKKYNFHTHTIRCGHATGLDEEYIINAIKNNYEVLGFSDHCPYFDISLPSQRMEWEEYPKYIESIKKLREKYKNDIKIFVGFECEYYDEHLNNLKELKQNSDYLILGQHHYLKNGRCFNYYDEFELKKMVDDIEKGMKSGLFIYLAHPDYYLRERPIWDDMAIYVANKICQLSLKYDIPLEINTKGIRWNKKIKNDVYYPYPEFWKIVSNYGCKVCIGIDAHSPSELDDIHEEVNKMIEKYNLNMINEEFLENLIKKKGIW